MTGSALIQGVAAERSSLHPRNKHRSRYDFDRLIEASPELAWFVKLNAYHDASIDFSDPQAVKALNRALLKQVYGIRDWDIPEQYLCPPIPGRADYLHYAADLLAAANHGIVPLGRQVRVLDIGVGANAVYPLIGQREYGWSFVGSDIDPVALANVRHILQANGLAEAIELRLQATPVDIFRSVVRPGETFDLTLCNPPFHASLEEAGAGAGRKWRNLGKRRTQGQAPLFNFGGQGAELCCVGGEQAFVSLMVGESVQFATHCLWFTTLVSKAASLPAIYRALKAAGALEVRTIPMAQGQKKSRIVAWTFLNAKQRRVWRSSHWQNAA
jgi:23S rRNA (adenine1618-N6)-methyltransferase